MILIFITGIVFKTFLLLFVTVSRKYSRTPLRIYDIVITYDLNIVILLRIVAFLKVFCMFLNKVILYGQKKWGEWEQSLQLPLKTDFFQVCFFFFRITCNHHWRIFEDRSDKCCIQFWQLSPPNRKFKFVFTKTCSLQYHQPIHAPTKFWWQ